VYNNILNYIAAKTNLQ